MFLYTQPFTKGNAVAHVLGWVVPVTVFYYYGMEAPAHATMAVLFASTVFGVLDVVRFAFQNTR